MARHLSGKIRSYIRSLLYFKYKLVMTCFSILLLLLIFVVIISLEFDSDDYAEHQYKKFTTLTVRKLVVSAAAENQPKQGQLFCWIPTDEKFHNTRVPAVHQTWSRRCDARHFFTNVEDNLPDDLPFHTIFRNLPYSYLSLFWKTHMALFFAYNNISSQFDWYLKADDDTYVYVENLRYYLSKYSPSKPYYMGFRLKLKAPVHGYNSGSAYVLSNKAMQLFAQELFNDTNKCKFHLWEDLGLARCLAALSIYPLDTRDEEGKQRFFAFRPEEHLSGKLNNNWVFDGITEASKDIFHDHIISFHHLTPAEILLAEATYRQKAQYRSRIQTLLVKSKTKSRRLKKAL